ncbi:MAG: hypothetical protein LUG45_08625 [Clostridiales bacterium]|nr:hypothetical protein [Clostridiales bacterium]
MDNWTDFNTCYADCTGDSRENILKQIEKAELALQGDKALLSRHHTLEYDQPFPNEDGCYQLRYKNECFEFFFKGRDSDRLYVFLDGSRSRDRGTRLADLPTFISWSWYPKISANVLCFEDPMFYQYPDLQLGWFYGSAQQDGRQLLAEVVDRIAVQLHIAHENIVLYGRSGGGTAALFAARYLPGCTAVGINPQLNLLSYGYYPFFQKITGIDLRQEPCARRTDLAASIHSDTKSHYIVMGNLESKEDMEVHFLPFCKEMGITPVYGAVQAGNTTVWLFRALGESSAHNSFENPTIFLLIDHFIAQTAPNVTPPIPTSALLCPAISTTSGTDPLPRLGKIKCLKIS